MKGCSNHAVISELYQEFLQGVCSSVATNAAHGTAYINNSTTEGKYIFVISRKPSKHVTFIVLLETKVDTRESERCCGMQGLSCRKKAKFDCEHK